MSSKPVVARSQTKIAELKERVLQYVKAKNGVDIRPFEVAKLLGYKQSVTAVKFLHELEKEGRLIRTAGKSKVYQYEIAAEKQLELSSLSAVDNHLLHGDLKGLMQKYLWEAEDTLAAKTELSKFLKWVEGKHGPTS